MNATRSLTGAPFCLQPGALRKRFGGKPPRTRFAPSPTGYLHAGHVLNALLTWALARELGGRVVLRMEDHDRQRSKPDYEAAILDDLDWLGLEPDAGLADEFRTGACAFRQSGHPGRYEKALAALQARGLVYGCRASRKEWQAQATAENGGELRYPNLSRGLGIPPGPGVNVRLRLPDEQVCAWDYGLGECCQRPQQQCGDLLLRDRRGNWSYQFAVAVDDWQEGIDLVIRGQDLLPSTGRQVLLARLLGRREPPAFVHHPLLSDATGRKLSKRDRDAGIRSRRGAGQSADGLRGEVLHAAGLLPHPTPMSNDAAFDCLLSGWAAPSSGG